uniref:Sarcoglycan, delta (dystrophin-associated glycoprotein) n=1 Tax=Gasterosteus aculeatus aculeatus TaxID=481459 RepID=A0AAQ4PNE6_GASAC
MMTQEQCTHRNNVQSSEKPQVYKVGIYGWRKRCLYFFVLLLMILILINLALTIWILKVMNFTIDGMGNLRITEKGLKLEGDSEFLQPLYAKEIQSKPGRPLFLQSSKNISVNIVNSNNQLLTQLVTGSSGFKARGKMFEVKSTSGKLLFSADEQEVVVGAERLRVMGAEGAVFSKSVETPHVRAEPFKELSRTLPPPAPPPWSSSTPSSRTDLRNGADGAFAPPSVPSVRGAAVKQSAARASAPDCHLTCDSPRGPFEAQSGLCI